VPPAAEPRIANVALLDMHPGRPNLGQEALVQVLQTATCDRREHLLRLDAQVLAFFAERVQPPPLPWSDEARQCLARETR